MRDGGPSRNWWNELIRSLDPLLRPQLLGPGQPLYSAGEEPTGVYLLRRGRVRLVAERGDSPQVLEAEALLGLSAAISAQRHSETAQAMEDCELDFVAREDLLELLQKDAGSALSVLMMLSEDVDVCYGKLRRLAGPAARRRDRKRA